MLSLSALTYSTIKSLVPANFLSACNSLKKKWLSFERDRLQIEFLQSCDKKGVVPKYLLELVPKRKRNITEYGEIQKKVIWESIAKRIESCCENELYLHDEMVLYSHMDKKLVQVILSHFIKRDVDKIREKNSSQLKSLCLAKEAKLFQKQLEIRPIVNISTHKLTKGETEALKNGFNMTWPSSINCHNVKVEIENLYSKLEKVTGVNNQNLDSIHTKLKAHYSTIERFKDKPFSQKVKTQLNNLHKLSKDESLYIARFDKGNGVCIDFRPRYIDKMNKILSDVSKFKEFKQDKRVNKNSFIYAEERFNRTLKDLFKKHKLDEEILGKITSTGSTPARLYGLPKIHKSEKDPPYRPVLSMRNSYSAKLSKYLDSLLKPFIPTERVVKDSFEFKNQLLEQQFPADCHFVSYDVKSLFTNIPVIETIEHILNIVPEDQIPFPKHVLRSLLTLACTKILFSFNEKLFTQEEGMCMGSSLGPTMAAFALDIIEKKFNTTPVFYKRYVDDVFAVFKSKEEADIFLEHINSFHQSLQFTIEHPVNNELNFLDVTVTIKDGTVSTRWLMKKTNTGVYLPNHSFSPLTYKTAAIRSLISRSYKLSSCIENFNKSYEKIRLIFINNGFNHKFIDKQKEKIIKHITTPPEKEEQEDIEYIYYKVPFIKQVEKETKRVFQEINDVLKPQAKVRLAYQTRKTSTFFPNKDRVPNEAKSHIVYQFTCSHCGGCYTGETVRHLSTRINEHLYGKPSPSEVSSHVHAPTKKSFSIALSTIHTKIGEALIYKEVPTDKRLNANTPGFTLKLF